MRQGGSEACARRRLRKRTIPSNPVGFEEKGLTASERSVKSGLPTSRRKSRQQPGAFDAKIFRRWRKEERFSSGATLRRSVAKFFRKCSGVLQAKSSADFGGVGRGTPERTGEGNARRKGERTAVALPAQCRSIECFVKTPQRSLTAMPSSRSSPTSFCASAGTASRHTGESPSSMVL